MTKLYRSRTDRKITGLCGGLAETLGFDATLLRLLVVITTLFSGGVVIGIYVLAALVIPSELGTAGLTVQVPATAEGRIRMAASGIINSAAGKIGSAPRGTTVKRSVTAGAARSKREVTKPSMRQAKRKRRARPAATLTI